MVEKVNGKARAGDFLGKDLEYITISCTSDIRPTSAGGDVVSQYRFDKLVEVISQRAQPILMGQVSGTSGTFGLMFAVEHVGAFGVTGATMLPGLVSAALKGTFTVYAPPSQPSSNFVMASTVGTYGPDVSTGIAVTIVNASTLLG